MTREKLATFVAVVVSLVWVGVAAAAVVERDYTALTLTTPLMLIIVGFLFGRRNGGGSGGGA